MHENRSGQGLSGVAVAMVCGALAGAAAAAVTVLAGGELLRRASGLQHLQLTIKPGMVDLYQDRIAAVPRDLAPGTELAEFARELGPDHSHSIGLTRFALAVALWAVDLWEAGAPRTLVFHLIYETTVVMRLRRVAFTPTQRTTVIHVSLPADPVGWRVTVAVVGGRSTIAIKRGA
jgi:hypothetical protein